MRSTLRSRYLGLRPKRGLKSVTESDIYLEIRPDALADIDEAATWYEEREPGLGEDFVRAIREAIDNLPANPLAHQLRNRRLNVRWMLPSRFPSLSNRLHVHVELITVIAVLHSARHDRHWKERV